MNVSPEISVQDKPVSAAAPAVDAADLTIFWHMGFIKTGTTAAQQMLRKNKFQMPPSVHVFRKQNDTVDLRLTAKAWRKSPTDENRRAVVQAVQAARNTAIEAGASKAIFSDENIVEFEPYNDRGDIFEASAKTLPLIEEAAYPAKSVFVFYTREFDKWLTSAYNQTVKMLRLTADFDEYCANLPFEKDWNVQRERLQASVKSDVVFYDMEDDIAKGPTIGAGLLRMAGIGEDVLDALIIPDRKNESLSKGALQFMLEVNRSELSAPAVKKIRQIVMQNPEAFA